MSNYSITTNFLAKDGLVSGNPAKLILGAQLTTEFANIVTAITSKYDSSTTTITLTGALNAGSLAVASAGVATIATFDSTRAGGGFINLTNSGVVGAFIGTGVDVSAGTTLGDLVLATGSSPRSIQLTRGGGNGLALTVLGTGAVNIAAPSGGVALGVSGVANQYTTQVTASNVSGQSYGLLVSAGTNSVDTAVLIRNQAAATNYLTIKGDGSGNIGPNGGVLGLSWTSAGAVSALAPTSGTALSVTGVATANSLFVLAPNTTSQSFGVVIQAGTNTNDYPLRVLNATGGTEFARIYGTGGVQLGGVAGGDQGLGALNAAKLFIAGVNIVQTGTFTGTLQGCTTAPTATFFYTVTNGVQVTVTLPVALTATSNSTSCSVSGLPAGITPLRNCPCYCTVADSGSSLTGQLNFFAAMLLNTTTGSFTAAGLKGLPAGGCWTYSLA